MTMLAGVGMNALEASEAAGRQAAAEAIAPLRGRPPTFLIVFATGHYDPSKLVDGIYAASGRVPLLGCCAGGIISPQGASRHGVVVLALQSDDLEITLGLAAGIRQRPVEISEQVAGQIENHAPPPESGRHLMALVLADGAATTLEEVVQSTATMAGPLCPLVGGGSGNMVQAHTGNLFVNDQFLLDALAVAQLSSTAPIGIGVAHGWTPVGRPLVVTRSRGPIVHELNGQSALEVYRRLFPEGNLTLDNFGPFVSAHPLGLPQISGEFIIRDPMRTHPDGSIECTATIPENTITHIMQGDKLSLCTAAQSAAQQALQRLGGRAPAAVFVFDCISRLNYLGPEAETEVYLIRDILGQDTPLAGMFSFGEVATAGGPAVFHNKTVVVCAIGKE